MTKQSRPIRSTILLYLARLPPGQVTWSRQVANEMQRRKLAKLSPHTASKVLGEFSNCGLVESVDVPPLAPTNPTSASVITMSWSELERQRKVKRLLRGGYSPEEIHELEQKTEHGLGDLNWKMIDQLVWDRKSFGLTPPDPRAKCYRLTSEGLKIAELLKQDDLLTRWWPRCRTSPTDNSEFSRELRARGFEPRHLDDAKKCGLLRIDEGEPELRPMKLGYLFQTLPSQALQSTITRRCRYRLT